MTEEMVVNVYPEKVIHWPAVLAPATEVIVPATRSADPK